MHTVFALLCFVVVIHWLIFPYPSGLLHWHCGNLTIAPVPAKQPWWIWINTSCEFIMNYCITTTKQSTTKPCAYFLGYTVMIIARYCCDGGNRSLTTGPTVSHPPTSFDLSLSNSDSDTIHWLRNVTHRALIHIIESILWSLMACNLFDPKASTAITFTMSNRGPYIRVVSNLSYGPPCKYCDVDYWPMLDLFQWAWNNITNILHLNNVIVMATVRRNNYIIMT